MKKKLKNLLLGTKLNHWLNTRIGTVHTFQGKEEVVIIVLGADNKNKGSAKWAASSLNLLNVAITRAKHYVYIIGDFNLWSRLNYFNTAANRL